MSNKEKSLMRLAFGNKVWAVIGASTNPDSFGNKIFKALKAEGLEVYPVSPKYDEVEGSKCYKSLADLPKKPQVVNFVTNPKITAQILSSVLVSSPDTPPILAPPAILWFQPNTFNDQILESLSDYNVIYEHCALVEVRALRRHMADVVKKTVHWLREKVSESGTKGLVVGVSGGIDSAVVANLIRRAFPEDSLGLILPCKSDDDLKDAQDVISASGIKGEVLDLTGAHQEILGGMEDASRLTDANLRARLRMATLYAYANQLGYLVVGTDNAAELYTGYFTKYGDGGIDIQPLAPHLKSDIYALARALAVPASIFKRQPSAGLWPGQTDEAELGITYDQVDLHLMEEAIPQKEYERLLSLHSASVHKRSLPPQFKL